MGFKSGPAHPRWKGGRSISSHGYVLIRMPEHPRAFSNGYVYEHILEAEKKLGRVLLPHEEVHHDDENTQNNVAENLIIEPSKAYHLFKHRRKDTGKKLPNEENRRILCACGCGTGLMLYDKLNRPRHFVSGHNMKRQY